MAEGKDTPPARLRAWLELLRLPNLLTVPGDPLMGYLAGGGRLDDPLLPWLAGAVLLLYALGLVDNDLCDVATDRVERPGRPLPSGRVGLGAARLARLGAALGGLALAARAGSAPLGGALVLLILILAYNRFKRYPPLGPALVALCRVMAVGIGLMASPLNVVNPLLLSVVPMVWFFHVLGLGLAAAGEAQAGRVRGRGVILATPLAWLGFAFLSTSLDRHLVGWAPGLVLGHAAAALAALVGLHAWLILRGQPAPAQVQRTVGGLIAAMVFLQASGCALLGAPHSGMHAAALVLLLLWLPIRRLGRRFAGS